MLLCRHRQVEWHRVSCLCVRWNRFGTRLLRQRFVAFACKFAVCRNVSQFAGVGVGVRVRVTWRLFRQACGGSPKPEASQAGRL